MSSTRQVREERRRASRRRVARRRRIAAGALLAPAVLVVVLASSGGGSHRAPRPAVGHTLSGAGSTASASVRLKAVVQQTGQLPAGVQDAAAAAIGPDSALLIGGLDQGDTSVADILRATSTGATRVGAL